MGVGDGMDQNNSSTTVTQYNKEYPKEQTHRQDRFACHLCLEGTTHALILANSRHCYVACCTSIGLSSTSIVLLRL